MEGVRVCEIIHVLINIARIAPLQSLRLEAQIGRGRGLAARVGSRQTRGRRGQLDLLYACRHRCRRPRGSRRADGRARVSAQRYDA